MSLPLSRGAVDAGYGDEKPGQRPVVKGIGNRAIRVPSAPAEAGEPSARIGQTRPRGPRFRSRRREAQCEKFPNSL